MAKVNAAVAELATSPDNLVRYQEIYLRMISEIGLEKTVGAKIG